MSAGQTKAKPEVAARPVEHRPLSQVQGRPGPQLLAPCWQLRGESQHVTPAPVVLKCGLASAMLHCRGVARSLGPAACSVTKAGKLRQV